MYVAKINNLLKHHGAVPLEALGPMQLHRLHRVKAVPGRNGRLQNALKVPSPNLHWVNARLAPCGR